MQLLRLRESAEKEPVEEKIKLHVLPIKIGAVQTALEYNVVVLERSNDDASPQRGRAQGVREGNRCGARATDGSGECESGDGDFHTSFFEFSSLSRAFSASMAMNYWGRRKAKR